MTDIDIKAIRAAAEAATPGPWRIDTSPDVGLANHVGISAERHGLLAQVVWKMNDEPRSPRCESTAQFIATANPATVLALCDEIERLQTLCNNQADELTKAHRELYGPSIADMVKGLKP